jgi:peptidoglycan hydrolase-like protein with peptidoglycan-binding domain
VTGTPTEVPYRRYGHRRRRWPYLAVAGLCVAAVIVGWQLWLVPWVSATTPGPDAFVSSQSPVVELHVRNLQQLTDVRVFFAGRDVTEATTLEGERLTFAPPDDLADGPYIVRFSARASNLFRRHVVQEWQFTVDTVDPTLEVDALLRDGQIRTDPAVFSGESEPGAVVTAEVAELTSSETVAADGAFRVEMALPEGRAEVVLTATDRAGNSVCRTLSLYVDPSPPTLEVSRLDRTVDKNSLTVRVSAEDGARAPDVLATLDDESVELDGPPAKGRLKLHGLAEGRHTLVVTATDRGGNEVTDTQVFTVDSTERFGAATLMRGARGKDVRQLQRRLEQFGVFKGENTGQFGKQTEAAVLAFQKKFGLTADGIVGPRMLMALSGHVVVDLSELKLYLYRDGELAKTYRVAAGAAEFPTPTGTYAIVSKVTNPTWYPPDSEWAKDAEPIPPGIENPLGTRWIGTSAPAVGIHGTPNPGSIGTYASHGCIRMYISDVEELFEKVAVGMPVLIRP